jgi:hypothetical protein
VIAGEEAVPGIFVDAGDLVLQGCARSLAITDSGGGV